MLLGNNHLSDIFAEVITIKILFALEKLLAIADCWGKSQGLKDIFKNAPCLMK